MHSDIESILLDKDAIQRKVIELADRISFDYGDVKPICICTLKGALFFTADLLRSLSIPIELDCMSISSYGKSATSSGNIKINKDLDLNVTGRHLLLIEDILDTGLTMDYLINYLQKLGAASLKTVVLLDKPSRRQVTFTPDYLGFEIPDAFVVGYGLDYAERYRNLPYIGVLRESVYK